MARRSSASAPSRATSTAIARRRRPFASSAASAGSSSAIRTLMTPPYPAPGFVGVTPLRIAGFLLFPRGLVTPLPADGGPVPGEIIEHQAHAIGHAAVLLADRGVLIAGDMLFDVLIPLLDPRGPDQPGVYEAALDRLGEAAKHVDGLIPGHGAVAEGSEVAARLATDRAYINALRQGDEPVDARL